jgi:hypothetical protein
MARFVASFEYLDFDGEGYGQAIKDYYHFKFITAIRDFLRAAVPRVPVQTGMARGSFLNLGRAVGVVVPIVPTRFKQKYYHRRGATPHAKNARTASRYVKYKVPRKSKRDKMSFEFNTRVLHFNLEEFIGVRSPSAPWASLEAGMTAFTARILEADDFPNMAEFTSKVRLSIGQGSGITRVKIPPVRRQATRRIT